MKHFQATETLMCKGDKGVNIGLYTLWRTTAMGKKSKDLLCKMGGSKEFSNY